MLGTCGDVSVARSPRMLLMMLRITVAQEGSLWDFYQEMAQARQNSRRLLEAIPAF